MVWIYLFSNVIINWGGKIYREVLKLMETTSTVDGLNS